MTVSIRLKEETAKILKNIAEKEMRPLSNLINKILQDYVRDLEKKKSSKKSARAA